MWNTLWVGLLVVAITLLLGLPAAYSLARLDRPWSGPMAIAIFFVYLVPPSLLFLSLSRLVVTFGLQDSTWSLVLVYPTITIPVSVWLLIGFLKAIPKDVEEQAMVDGYSRLAAEVPSAGNLSPDWVGCLDWGAGLGRLASWTRTCIRLDSPRGWTG